MKNKWTLLAFLCGIFFVYTVDRSMLGILTIPIQKETGISDTAFGILNAAIFWTYAAFVPFAGLIGDRLDRHRLIGVAAIVWSVMMVAAGFAGGFWSLLILASLAVTAPQTLYGPSANALISVYHAETWATAFSLHQAAYYTGWFVSGIAVAGVIALFGSWRAAYFVFGGLGLVLGAIFLIARRASAGRSEIGVCQTGDRAIKQSGKPTFRQSLLAFFGCPSALLAAAGYVAIVFVSFGYSAWGPKFVALKFGLTPGKAGAGVMFWHYAAAFAAILFAGVLTDACVIRWPRFRLVLQSAALLLAAPLLALFGLGTSVAMVFAVAAAFGILRGLFESNAFTSLFDVIRPENRASAVGFLNVLAGMIGSLAPIILGTLSDRLGLRGFEIGFTAFGGVLLLGALAMMISCRFTFNKDHIRTLS